MKKKEQEKKGQEQDRRDISSVQANSDYEVTDVLNATTRWRWEEKAILRASVAAICHQGAAADEMLLVMKWDCSVLSIYRRFSVDNSDSCYHHGYHAWQTGGFAGNINNTWDTCGSEKLWKAIDSRVLVFDLPGDWFTDPRAQSLLAICS